MKTIIKYISILLITLTVFNCDDESNFNEPNISLTPVYSITDIDGTDTPFKINIYRQKNLIIEYASEVNVSSFISTNYMDSSTDTTYQISVNKENEGTSTSYSISADKATGDGTLTIDASTVYNISVAEEQVYN